MPMLIYIIVVDPKCMMLWASLKPMKLTFFAIISIEFRIKSGKHQDSRWIEMLMWYCFTFYVITVTEIVI